MPVLKATYKLYGKRFAIFKTGKQDALYHSRLAETLLEAKHEFIRDVIPSTNEILISFTITPEQNVLERLLENQPEIAVSPREWKVPVSFDTGLDWRTAESITGLSKDSYITRFLDVSFTISSLGFLPGFIYLDGLPEALQLPRKDVPDKRVPARALGVGGPYAGIYNYPSPGGWHILGRIMVQMVDENAFPPLACRPGDIIRFVRTEEEEPDILPDLSSYNDSI